MIAVGGAYGTLSEIAFALMLGRPVIGLGTWQLRDPGGLEAPIVRVETAEAAVAECERLAAPRT